MIRIVIIDDHTLVREGIRALLEREDAFEVVGEADDGQRAVGLAQRLRPDVILMDLNLPGGIGGLEAAEAILAVLPDVKIIILTQYQNREYVKRAVQIGAHGYLPKSSVSEQLREAILTVHRGRRYFHPLAAEELVELVANGEGLEDEYARLTPREKQVLKLLAEGKTSRQIAKYLDISVKTAMTHRAHLMSKLQVHSRTELIKYAIRNRIIEM